MTIKVNSGLVGHKIKDATSGRDVRACIDSEPQFDLFHRVDIQDGETQYHAIYCYVGETVSGSAYVNLGTSATASVTASGYIVMMSAGLQAVPGEYVWVRTSAFPGSVGWVAN